MSFHRYNISILADDDLTGDFILSDEEAEVIRRIIKGLKRTGPYAPTVHFDNLDELAEQAAERAKEQEKRRREEAERRKRDLEEAMGLNRKFPTTLELAFQKAKEKKNGK